MTTRRSFIKNASLLTAGAFILPKRPFLRKNKAIGIQLWTVRDVIEKDVKGVLAKVAKTGYKEVEPYGFSREGYFWGIKPTDFKKILLDNGLRSPSGHYDINSFLLRNERQDIDACIEAANVLGSSFLTIPSMDGSLLKSAEACHKTAKQLNVAGTICKKAGLKLAYHNHNTEFQPLGNTYGYEILLKETDPELVHFEMDLYWIVRAGKRPLDLFGEFPGRFPMWHVKDMDKNNVELNTEIGKGTIDFKAIFQEAKKAGLQHFFLEQEDNYVPDLMGSIAGSYQYIQKELV